MVRHWAGGNPPPDPFVSRDVAAFRKLPQGVQDALNRFHGDAAMLETALLSSISHYPQREQRRYRGLIFRCLGLTPRPPRRQREDRIVGVVIINLEMLRRSVQEALQSSSSTPNADATSSLE